MLKRPPTPVSMTLNLAPMVDVMMCLIVFFLLASKLADHAAVDLPWAVAAKSVKPGEITNPVTITVRPAGGDGDVAEYLVKSWDGQKVTEQALQPRDIDQLLQAHAARAAREGQPLRCVIRADRAVRYKHVEVVLRACGLAKIASVVFQANQGVEAGGGA